MNNFIFEQSAAKIVYIDCGSKINSITLERFGDVCWKL